MKGKIFKKVEWKGTFSYFEDSQSLGRSIVCDDFEVKLCGKWVPVDFWRFKKSDPISYKDVERQVEEKLNG